MYIQKFQNAILFVLIGLSFSLVACGSASLKTGYSISRPFSDNPNKIRFDLENMEPLPELPLNAPEIGQNMDNRFIARATIYAKQKLDELQLCPNGFIPPKYVLGVRAGHRLYFVITCK